MTSDLFFLNSPELWKGIAFFISISILIFPLYRVLIKKVRIQSKQIASHIEEALKLRREAEDMLKSAQHKDFYKDKDRRNILQSAIKESESLKKEAACDLDALMLRREKENEERVCLIRENGLKELKDKVLEIAVKTTRDILGEANINKSQEDLMAESLKDLENVLADKAQKEQLLKAID